MNTTTITAAALLAMCSLLSLSAAYAEANINLGVHSDAEISRKCKAAGGNFDQDKNSYGCTTNCKGGAVDGTRKSCNVSCQSSDQTCTGQTPDRIGSRLRNVTGILGSSPGVSQPMTQGKPALPQGNVAPPTPN